MYEKRTFFRSSAHRGSSCTVNGIGVLERMPPGYMVDRPGTGDFFLMLRYSNENSYDELIIWEPQKRHYYGNPENSWLHSWMHWEGPAVASMLRRNRIPLNTPLECHHLTSNSITQCLRELYDECVHVDFMEEILVKLLETLLLRISRGVHSESRLIPENLLKVRQEVETSVNLKWNLKRMAKVAGWSASHFSAEFKRYFHCSPARFLTEQRMQQAGFLLQTRQMRVGEVAASVGYENIYHFSRSFKLFHGVSPTEYASTAK